MIHIKNIHHLKAVLLRGEDCFMVMLSTGGMSNPFIYYSQVDKRFIISYGDMREEYSESALLIDEVIGQSLKFGRLYLKD